MDSKEKQNIFVKISKKILISFLLIAIVVVSIPFNYGFAAGFTVTQEELTDRGITIKVESGKTIKELYLLTKSSTSDKYVYFYKYTGASFTSKSFFVSKNRLSTSLETGLRVMVVYTDGQRETNILELPMLPSTSTPESPVIPSSNPSTNPPSNPSTNPTSNPTSNPTPDPVPSSTVKPSTNPPSSPSSNPTSTPTPDPTSGSTPAPTSNPSIAPTLTPKPTQTPEPEKSKGAQKVEKKINKAIEKGSLTSNDKVYYLDVQDKKWQVVNGKKLNYGKASDCIILESNGKFAMIDTSINKDGHKKMATRVLAYLEALDVKELEFVLISHAHDDHASCYPAISKKIKIKNLYIKKREKLETYEKVIKAADKQGTKKHFVTSSANNRIALGDFNIKLYNTKQRIAKTSSGVDKKTASGKLINENVNSIVALVTIHGKKLVFTGDIGKHEVAGNKVKEAENTVAKNIGKVDVYKASHHGYGTRNNSKVALNYYSPQYAVITNTSDRADTEDTWKRLKKAGVEKNHIYATGDGTVILDIDINGTLTFKQIAKDDNINFDK